MYMYFCELSAAYACASDSVWARELRGHVRSSPVYIVMAVKKFYGLKWPVSSDEGDGESSITVYALVAVIPVPQLDIS